MLNNYFPTSAIASHSFWGTSTSTSSSITSSSSIISPLFLVVYMASIFIAQRSSDVLNYNTITQHTNSLPYSFTLHIYASIFQLDVYILKEEILEANDMSREHTCPSQPLFLHNKFLHERDISSFGFCIEEMHINVLECFLSIFVFSNIFCYVINDHPLSKKTLTIYIGPPCKSSLSYLLIFFYNSIF